MIRCSRCQLEKEPNAFSFKNVESGKRQAYCRPCQAAWRREHYEANRGAYVARSAASNKKLNERNRQFVYEYLLSHPCVGCGEADPVVLEFDHCRGEKSGNISEMIYRALSIAAISKELDKCQVLCANCHRRKTARERHWWYASAGSTEPSRSSGD